MVRPVTQFSMRESHTRAAAESMRKSPPPSPHPQSSSCVFDMAKVELAARLMP